MQVCKFPEAPAASSYLFWCFFFISLNVSFRYVCSSEYIKSNETDRYGSICFKLDKGKKTALFLICYEQWYCVGHMFDAAIALVRVLVPLYYS